MKITHKLILILCLVLIINSKTINKMKPSEDELEAEKLKVNQKKVKLPFEDKINELFNVEENEGECKDLNFEEEEAKKKAAAAGDGTEQQQKLPYKKADPWADYSKGDSAYLFDHLDDVLQEKITAKLTNIYTKALENQSKLLDTQTRKDPYSYDDLLSGFFSGKFDGALDSNKEKLVEIVKDFKHDDWKDFITVPAADDIIRKWLWQPFTGESIKNTFDRFDFNGDGRLDKREFLYFSIQHNIPLFGKGQCTPDTCYDDLFANLIDPMYYFMDCNKDGNLEAEEMWKGLSKLKRKDHTKYSLFSCKLKLDFEKEYRTISVSDFILSNAKKNKGTVTLDEFRSGILMGYVKRQVKLNKIVADDTNNRKADRWNKEGTKDNQCISIQYYLNTSKSKKPDAKIAKV